MPRFVDTVSFTPPLQRAFIRARQKLNESEEVGYIWALLFVRCCSMEIGVQYEQKRSISAGAERLVVPNWANKQ